MNSKESKKVIFIVGPTGVGKSAVAVELARRLDAEIISADSMQMYRGMDIGTAKLSLQERGGIPHHLLDIASVRSPLDVASYRKQALQAIEKIFERGKIPIVVGGSGLYVRSLTDGLFEGPAGNPQLRRRLTALAENKGNSFLHEELRKIDPEAAARIKPNDRRRLIRALEVYESIQKPITDLQTQWKTKRTTINDQRSTNDDQRTTINDQRSTLLFGLTMERTALYYHLNERVDQMFACGLVEETARLLREGLAENPVALQAIGYKEVAAHLRGELALEEAKARVKLATRHFAKRQLTWFRRDPRIQWIEVSPTESIEQIAEILYNKRWEAIRDS